MNCAQSPVRALLWFAAVVLPLAVAAQARADSFAQQQPAATGDTNDLPKRVEVLERAQKTSEFLTKLGSYFKLYGFARIDAVYDDSEPNTSQIPIFIASEDVNTGAHKNDDYFSLYTRLTRIGFDFNGPTLESFDVDGKIEVDFYGAGSNSRNSFRMRHAYLTLKKGNVTFLGGQTIDLVSPLWPSANPDMLNWNAGNPGDRRPQARLTYEHKHGEAKFLVQGALALQSAIDNSDANGDTILDGEDAGLPQLQARLGFEVPSPVATAPEGKAKGPLSIGIWGARGWEETDVPVAGDDDFNVILWGLDANVYVGDTAYVRGEIWKGSNLDDLRGGIGQGVVAGEEVHSQGYWIEFGGRPSQALELFVGYSADEPNRTDVTNGGAAAGRTRNEIGYAGGKIISWKPVEVGFEYMHWETDFRGIAEGRDNRYRLWIAYHF